MCNTISRSGDLVISWNDELVLGKTFEETQAIISDYKKKTSFVVAYQIKLVIIIALNCFLITVALVLRCLTRGLICFLLFINFISFSTQSVDWNIASRQQSFQCSAQVLRRAIMSRRANFGELLGNSC